MTMHSKAMAGSSDSRRAASPWHRLALLPAVLLLAGLCLLDAAPAAAQNTWSATLTVQWPGDSSFGCDNPERFWRDNVGEPNSGVTKRPSSVRCSTGAVLTDNNFRELYGILDSTGPANQKVVCSPVCRTC